MTLGTVIPTGHAPAPDAPSGGGKSRHRIVTRPGAACKSAAVGSQRAAQGLLRNFTKIRAGRGFLTVTRDRRQKVESPRSDQPQVGLMRNSRRNWASAGHTKARRSAKLDRARPTQASARPGDLFVQVPLAILAMPAPYTRKPAARSPDRARLKAADDPRHAAVPSV